MIEKVQILSQIKNSIQDLFFFHLYNYELTQKFQSLYSLNDNLTQEFDLFHSNLT